MSLWRAQSKRNIFQFPNIVQAIGALLGQKLTQASKRLQERPPDTPTKGLQWTRYPRKGTHRPHPHRAHAVALERCSHTTATLSSDNTFQETSAQYKAVSPEQWLQRHPEAGSSWPSWSQASHIPRWARAGLAGRRSHINGFFCASKPQNLTLVKSPKLACMS